METQRKLIVGYDLCEDYSQISCYSYKSFEPISISPTEDEENCLIPTVLCIEKESKLWLYGEEAVACASRGGGILVDSILTKILTGEEVEIFNTKFGGVALLEKFLRKTLTLIKNHFPTEPITKIVVTIGVMEQKVKDGIYKALSLLGIEKDRAVILHHTSSYLYYALSQDRSLWANDVGLFDFNKKECIYYQISLNRRTQPMIAAITKKDISEYVNYSMLQDKESSLAYAFENSANTLLYKQIISTIYFTGIGFETGWANDLIKGLCKGRRVFLGQNLYSKGACYAAKELSGDIKLEDIVFLTEEMVTSQISLRVYVDGKIKEITLTDAAIPWYEVCKNIEVIPDEEQEIEIILKNILTRDIRREKLTLYNIPIRPNRMTRLGINLTCTDKSNVKIIIKDLGFGEIYPEQNQSCEFSLVI